MDTTAAAQLARDSGIQTTSGLRLVRSKPASLKELTAAILAGPPQRTPEQIAEANRREEQRKRAEDQAARSRWLSEFMNSVGSRYYGATLDAFQATRDDQRRVLAALRGYLGRLADEVKSGSNIIMFGPAGAGKDFALVAMARALIAQWQAADDTEGGGGCASAGPVRWQNGVSLYRLMRDRIGEDRREADVLHSLTAPPVLILSDVAPPDAVLTDFQKATLFEVIDHRYRWRRPTWVSMNVSSGREADERLGRAIADRLRHDALALWCGWPSYRHARTLAETQDSAGNEPTPPASGSFRPSAARDVPGRPARATDTEGVTL
jgi:DNA replication protein DnaC